MAAPPVEIKIKGVRQLEAGARRLFEDIEQATDEQATRVTADQVAMSVRARVPKHSGRLAASVHSTQRGRTRQVAMGAGLEYARWIEYGGGRGRKYRKGGRYLLPTARRTTSAFRKHAAAAAETAIKRTRWPTPT